MSIHVASIKLQGKETENKKGHDEEVESDGSGC